MSTLHHLSFHKRVWHYGRKWIDRPLRHWNNSAKTPSHPSPQVESRLQRVFAHAAVGFCVATIDGQILEVNPRFCEITGYDDEELRHLRITDLIHPDERHRDEEMLRSLTSDQVASLIIEKRFIKKSGEIVWVRNSVSLVPSAESDRSVIRVAEDVTAFRQAEERRRESEERYVRLADSMPQIVWTTNPDGFPDYFNRRWTEYTGLTLEQSMGNWTSVFHPDDVPRIRDAWLRSARTGENYDQEIRLRSKGGDYRWHFSRAVPARDEAGKITRWFGTTTDFHEVKLLTHELESARRAIETEQQKFRTLISDASTSMAVLRGPELRYEIANKSYLDLFNNRSLIGKSLTEALPELVGQEFPARARHVYETGEIYSDREAKALLRRDANSPLEDRYFDQTYSRVVDQEQKPYGVFIHAREVTDRVVARRQLEEAAESFRIAVETANMGTWELNPQSNIVILSPRTIELFGLQGSESMPLQVATERVHPEDRARVEAAITAALDPEGSGDYQIEYRIVHANGETRWVALLGKTFFAETSTGRVPTRFIGNILDVTDRVLAEVALRDAKERAESASAAKSAFLANMSHEIRTPLGAIMGFVSLMRDEGINQQMLSEYVSVIERNSSQLMRIIDDILDLSKVEAGMMLIEHLDFSLIELLSDFASLMEFRAREKGIQFDLKAKTELPQMVNSDPMRLRQILTNVVGNAIKFTEAGYVRLLVSYHDQMIEFEVEDSGRGIPDDQSERLFLPFSQGDVSTTRKYGGTGLGLVLTRRLSEAMGGTFNLKRSTPGGGSVFTSTVRVQTPLNVQMVKALGFASEPIRPVGLPSQLQGLKVLLVEDSPDNQALFSTYLKRAGASVDIAGDGAQGCAMALAGPYDIVLMDVQMPIMDGISAAKKLRALGYPKPIIALTAHAMKEERTRCLEAGYTEFLSKPVRRQELLETLERYASL